jgi:hypothetical protein
MVTNPYIARLLVESHIDDLHRKAGRVPPARTADGDAQRRADKAGVPAAGWRLPRPKRALSPACDPCA